MEPWAPEQRLRVRPKRAPLATPQAMGGRRVAEDAMLVAQAAFAAAVCAFVLLQYSFQWSAGHHQAVQLLEMTLLHEGAPSKGPPRQIPPSRAGRI